MSSDYSKKYTSINSFIPESYKTEFNEAWFRNLHDKLLTKDESVLALGYIGSKIAGDSSPYLPAADLDRQINPLIPTVYAQLGTQKYAYTFEDVLSKASLLGIDTNSYASWGALQGFNFVPPIDIDQFSNYTSYYWYGAAIGKTPAWNTSCLPEYYVIQRGGISDWSTGNYWIHEADAASFFASNGWAISINDCVQAVRPIICFDLELEVELLVYFENGVPSSSGTLVNQRTPGYKSLFNQAPYFNLYLADGTHAGLLSPIFYYSTSNAASIDQHLQIRAATNSAGEYLFSSGLVTNDGSRILFFKNNGVVTSAWIASTSLDSPIYYTENSAGTLVESDPATDLTSSGAWTYPSAMFYNIEHENRKQVGYGDLIQHFISIIKAQPGISGNPYGSNNFRTLSANYGLGGTIKDFNSNFGLFLGVMNQPNASILSIIDFAKNQYADSLNAISEFIKRNIGNLINDTSTTLPNSTLSNTIDSSVESFYQDYLSFIATRNDSTVFVDTTSSIPNFPATLPYLGLAPLVSPQIYFDQIVGSLFMVHHDGHLASVQTSNADLEIGLANEIFTRSDGNKLPGVVGYVAPIKPYARQFWYDKNTNTLKTYNVVTDQWTSSMIGQDGLYYFDRTNLKLYQYSAAQVAFLPISDLSAPWTIVNTSAIAAQIRLILETNLYNKCPCQYQKLSIAEKISNGGATAQAKIENFFSIFCSANGLNSTATDFNAADAFTWNYSQAYLPGVPTGARWFTIYAEYFGTARPNLQPWILQGYTSKPTWWQQMYGDTTGTRLWTTQMWNDILNDTVPGVPAPKGKWLKKLGVNIYTDQLLPPYVSAKDPNSDFAIFTSIPPGISGSYSWWQMGPSEVAYKTSIDFLYDELKVCFQLDPINFISATWGFNYINVGDYILDRHDQKKISYKNLVLHGETPTSKLNGYLISDFFQSPNIADTSWTLTCVDVSPTGSIFSIVGDVTGEIEAAYLCNTKLQNYNFVINIQDLGADFNIGDKFIITSSTGEISFVPTTVAKFNGLSQWFVNLCRYFSIDLSISLSNLLLRNWSLNLAYRCSGLIDTSSLTLSTDQYEIHNSDFTVMIKENLNVKSYWLNSLIVTLIQMGSTTIDSKGRVVPVGKGDDWIFRISTTNPFNPSIEYYEYDQTKSYTTFYALDQANTSENWFHYSTKAQLVSQTTPIIVTGIEAAANIIFGYVDKITEDGWLFNQNISPAVDVTTGRNVNWQLFIEKFINQQYLGIGVNTSVLLNPFSDAIWFKTDVGFVADLSSKKLIDPLTSQVIFDSNGNIIPSSDIRVTRNEDTTMITSNVVMGGLHLLVNQFEHLILFNDYTYQGDYLIYDPYLGVNVNRIWLSSRRQSNQNGRLSFGGYYVYGDKVQRNIEASTSDILKYYDGDLMDPNSAWAPHARALLGYQQKSYMSNLGLTDRSQFAFWQGLVANKGSNFSVTAFLNSAQFKQANIDEYWAYKIGSYGDAREVAFPEIKLNVADVSQYTKIQFNLNDLSLAAGFINISPLDENRWVGSNIPTSYLSFPAAILASVEFVAPTNGQIYSLTDSSGSFVFADSVLAYEQVQLINSADENPFWLPVTNVTLVNSSTIEFSADNFDSTKYKLYNNVRTFKIDCYGPSYSTQNPAILRDYANNVSLLDLDFWDPARGNHVPQAFEIVNIMQETDPAVYSYSLMTADNSNYDPYRQWNASQVGKIWWDNSNLNYIPYSDSNIFPSLDTRLAYWGALTDYSSVNLYEWVESTVPPANYSTLVASQQGDSTIPANQQASGTPIKKLYTRERSWQQRPIAWAFTDAPGNTTPSLQSVGEYTVSFRQNSSAETVAILSASDWQTQFSSLAVGSKISSGLFYYNVNNDGDLNNFNLIKPYGEAVVTGINQDIYIGSSTSVDAPVFNPPSVTFTGAL